MYAEYMNKPPCHCQIMQSVMHNSHSGTDLLHNLQNMENRGTEVCLHIRFWPQLLFCCLFRPLFHTATNIYHGIWEKGWNILKEQCQNATGGCAYTVISWEIQSISFNSTELFLYRASEKTAHFVEHMLTMLEREVQSMTLETSEHHRGWPWEPLSMGTPGQALPGNGWDLPAWPDVTSIKTCQWRT